MRSLAAVIAGVRRRGRVLRVTGAVLAALGLLSVAVIGGEAPVWAQEADSAGVGISLSNLSDYPTHLTVDGFMVELTNLTATEAYQVTVSSDSAGLGIGGCGTASQTETVTGVAAQELPFLVYACAVGEATVTAEVRRTGATSPEASVSRDLTVEELPDELIRADGERVRAPPPGTVVKAGTPGIVMNIQFREEHIEHRSVKATWDRPSNGGTTLTGYGLLFWPGREDQQPPWDQATVIGRTEAHTFEGLTPNTRYNFRIHACNGVDSCGYWTHPPKHVTTLPEVTPIPVPPTGRPARPHTISIDEPSAGDTSLTLRWSADADTGGRPLTRFQVQRRQVSGAWLSPNEARRSDRSYPYHGLEPGITYGIHVRACNGSNDTTDCSAWSVEVTKTVPGRLAPPPSNFRETGDSDTSVTLGWDTVTGATQYQVHEIANPNVRFVITHPTDTVTVPDLTCGTTYTFKIKSHGDGTTYESEWGDAEASATATTDACPPADAVPSFGSATVADQWYLTGKRVFLQLPAATGGDGQLIYSIAPPVDNGLGFIPFAQTRTIDGAPLAGANPVVYTYTATDTDGDTARLSFSITVFDLFVRAQRRDDDNARQLRGATFWGGVYERWGALNYALVWMEDVMPAGVARTGSYRFQLRLPASTGFQPSANGECSGPAAAPGDTTQLTTDWMPSSHGFYLVRCGFGSSQSAAVEIWVQVPGGREARLDSRTVGGEAWHVPDHVLSYRVAGTTAGVNGDTIELIASDRDSNDGLYPPPTSGTLAQLNGDFRHVALFEGAADAWGNLGAGVSLTRITSNDSATVPDAMIKGYWDPNPGKMGKDGTCGGSIACMYITGPYPHLENNRKFMIESPPHWGHEDNARIWTTDFDKLKHDDAVYQYLPAVLVHEFGHAIGLQHSAGPGDVMNGAVRQGLSDNDQQGARATYAHHTSH